MPTGNFISLGCICEILQIAPAAARRFADKAGVKPAFTIDGREHFNQDDLPTIGALVPDAMKNNAAKRAGLTTGDAGRK